MRHLRAVKACTRAQPACKALKCGEPNKACWQEMHLDGRQVIEDEDSRQLAPVMGVHRRLEVLCHRVLIALYRLVMRVDVCCWHHLQTAQA